MMKSTWNGDNSYYDTNTEVFKDEQGSAWAANSSQHASSGCNSSLNFNSWRDRCASCGQPYPPRSYQAVTRSMPCDEGFVERRERDYYDTGVKESRVHFDNEGTGYENQNDADFSKFYYDRGRLNNFSRALQNRGSRNALNQANAANNTPLSPRTSYNTFTNRQFQPEAKSYMRLYDKDGRMYLLVRDDDDETVNRCEKESWVDSLKETLRASSENLKAKFSNLGTSKSRADTCICCGTNLSRRQSSQLQSSVFQPPRLQSTVFEPFRRQSSVFQPSKHQSEVFEASRLDSPVFRPSRLQSAVFEPSRLQSGLFEPSRDENAAEKNAKKFYISDEVLVDDPKHHIRYHAGRLVLNEQ